MLTVDKSTAAPAADAPRGGTLAAWLDWQLRLHSRAIDLGLDRVREVAQRLGVLPLPARCVVVAGTNGKGSCVHLIEALLRDRGHNVGSYTSPHLWRYNERVRIDGCEAGDDALCAAFEAVELAREVVSLTFFEYGTLAALWLFRQAGIDHAVLEIGLGGRLDAVNIIDADVALITNIGLDHADYLGATREAIGAEKAGVMRSRRPVVSADRDLPRTVATHAADVGAQLYRIGDAFEIDAHGWRGWDRQGVDWLQPLPAHVLADNLASALAVVELLGELPHSAAAVMRACAAQRTLRGRCEIVEDGPVPVVYDVAHNVEAVALLVAYLRNHPVAGATHVVIGMLADKPVEAVAGLLAPLADCFYAADLAAISERGFSDRRLDATALARRVGHGAEPAGVPAAALARARMAARPGDRIVVCGSFYTVAHARLEP